jgi:hypothetical protein
MEQIICEPVVSKILLCGLSGSGKTTTGNRLTDLGWTHIDCEQHHLNEPDWITDPLKYIPDKPNVVATWGLVPRFIATAWTIIDSGFTVIWLSGKQRYLARDLINRGEGFDFVNSQERLLTSNTQYLVNAEMVLNAFRPDGSRWNVAGFIHSVYWTV